MTIYEYLDSILKERRMSRRKLALAAGIPPSTLQSAFERKGKMSLDMLASIANVLQLSLPEEKKLYQTFGYEVDFVEESEDDKELFDEVFSDLISEREKKNTEYENYLSEMAEAYSKLNSEGQHVAVERVQELTEIKKYQKGQ